MPTECERTNANTQQQTVPQTQQQQQQQQQELENALLLPAGENCKASSVEEEGVVGQEQRELTYDDMEAKELNGSKMSTSQTSITSQTSTTSSTNGHSSGNNTNGVGKKTSIISPDPTPYVTKERVTRPTPPPPPYNPMQFVQIKPCNLYQTAQEQLKKAEEVKKIKEIKKEDPEDWQNNLDNWKSSRRKRVEHIIDRVVEVKKLELEEHDRTRRKSKTFSEMIEERGERGARGRVKLATLAVYNEDESNDLSDLGIGTSSASGKSSQSEDYDNNSVLSDNAELDKAIQENNQKPTSIPAREYISSPGYDTSSSTAPGSSPDPCEYTYEGAIQDYKQRVSRASAGSVLANYKNNTNSKTHSSKETTSECKNTPNNDTSYPTRRGSKIEDRLMGFEVTSPSDSQEGLEKKVDVPKIDISKRKEIFENQNANTEPKSLGNSGTGAGNIAVPRVTLRDRFKLDETANGNGEIKDSTLKREVKRLSGDITSVRSRMQSLEQQQNLVNSTNGFSGGKTSNSKLVDIPVPPLKERLSSLQNAATKEEVKKAPVALVDARQLEIMKNEEEQRKKQIEHEQREQVHQNEVSKPAVKSSPPLETLPSGGTQETVVVKIVAPEEEVDRDDSGIHTADGETDEQELQLNAAIAALALEEQQLTEAANAVNQFEAEFDELSTSVVNAIANDLAVAAANTSTTNEQPCEMEFSINEALELALEAIDKETKCTMNETTTTKATTKTLNTTAACNQNTKTITTKLETLTKTTTLIDNNKKDAANRTDEEKEFKSKQQNIMMPNNYNNNKNPNNTTTIYTINKNAELNNKSVSNTNNYEDFENSSDAVALETRISQEPIYENISAASTRQVDTDARRNMNNNNNNNNASNNQTFNQIENSNNNNNNYDNSIANNANNLLSNLTNNNNNSSNSNNCKNNNSNNNNRNSYNASVNSNSNNNSQVAETSLIQLTNAFANATTKIQTAPTTTKVATVSLIASEKTHAMLNNSSTTKTPTTASAPNAANGASTLPTNPTIPHKTTTHLSPNNHQHADQIELEPYYQVPKSSEPYYDAPKHLRPVPLYENIEVFYTGLENSTLAGGTGATLSSSFKLEPPKEKPPPPPVDSPPPFDDVDSIDNTDTWSSDNTYETISARLPHINGLAMDHPSPPIKRMNSTKRIKKELRNKRSSFLGIDTTNLDDDESFLELTVAPPPDMAQLLQEERRLEKQLYLKAGLCDSSDTGESRDSGVSENHSRQSSEHYTNSSEENVHQIDSPPHSLKSNGLIYQNEALLAAVQTPLLQTVKGNSAESWTESATVAAAATKSLTEATATANAKMLSIEEKIREQEEVLRVERELLQLEQEELKRQRENLMLRENMARRELQHGAKMLMSANRRSLQDLNGVGMSLVSTGATYQSAVPPQYALPPPHHGIQQSASVVQQQQYAGASLLTAQQTPQQIYANVPNLQQQQYYQVDNNYRKSMSDLQEFAKRHMLPPPTPPTKPMRAMHISTNTATNAAALTVSSGLDKLNAHRNSMNAQAYSGSLVKIATPTAAPRGHTIYSNHQTPYHHQSTQNLTSSSASNNASDTAPVAINGHPALPGNMSRNTLLALSATPKPKYTDGWVQVQQRKSYDSNLANDPAWLSAYHQKRKSLPDAYHAYNNHWVVQEAEQRGIAEQRRVNSTGATPVHQQKGGGASALKNSTSANSNGKPLPDSIIQTLTERVQSKGIGERKRFDTQPSALDKSPLHAASTYYQQQQTQSQQLTPSHQRHLSAGGSIGTNSAAITATMPPQTHVNASPVHQPQQQQLQPQDKVLSVSGKKKCSHCGDELGRGAAMIIESLLLFYHINCFKCCVCHVQLGDGLNGTDVRVRNHKLHCQNCYSSDDGIKFSCV